MSIFLFNGCSQPEPPKWYFQTYNDAMVCGDGSGTGAQEAKEQSFVSLSHAIGMTIDAHDEYHYEYHDGKTEHIRAYKADIQNLFPTLSHPMIERYESKKNGFKELHFVRTCVTKESLVDGMETALKDDAIWLEAMNPKSICLSKEGRVQYNRRKEQILSRLTLLRSFGRESEVIKNIEAMGYVTPMQEPLHVEGNAFLVDPLISKLGIATGHSKASLKVFSREESHVFKKGKVSSIFLCVLRVKITLISPCAQQLYAAEEKCVDEGKTKKVALQNAQKKMQRQILVSGLKDALANY